MSATLPDSFRAALGGDPSEIALGIDRLVDSLQRLRLEIGAAGGEASAALVMRVVSRRTGVTECALLGRSRPEHIAWPRHIVAWCLVEVAGLTLTAAGRAMDRDHGSIHNSKEQVWSRMEIDPVFRTQVERIRDELKPLLKPKGK